MGWVVRFVDKPDADRTVRLDLNAGDDAPGLFAVHGEGVDLGTVGLLRALVGSMLQDGETQTASARTNRTLTIPLRIRGDGADAAAAMNLLARELDRRVNYLEWQPEGVDEPVFFVCMRGEITDVDFDDAGAEYWPLAIELLCEPTAVGLEVSGSDVTTTDPAGANNPLVVLPTVRGDVPAPLTVKVGANAMVTSGPFMVSVCSGPSSFSTPFFVQAEALTQGTDTVTQPFTSNRSGSGNNYSRVSYATDNTLTPVRLSGSVASVPAGRWRVWARVESTNQFSVHEVRLDVGTAASHTEGQVKTFTQAGSVSGTDHWFDLGSIEHPYYQPSDAAAAEDLSVRVHARRTSPSGSLDFDVFLLVPEDLRGETAGRTAFVTPTVGLVSGDRWRLIPDQQMVFASVPAKPAAIVGSHDFKVAPGANNYVHVLRTVYPGTSGVLADQNNVDWSYRPRWLYLSAP